MRVNISSAKNPRIRELNKLHEKKYRSAAGAFLIEGLRFVREARLQGAQILSYIVSADNPGLVEQAGIPEGAETILVPAQVLKELSATVNPQGIMAKVSMPEAKRAEDFLSGRGLWFYLDEIQDPGNLGTIIRSAHAFALDGLILSRGCADPFQDKVLRSTMGSIFRVPLFLEAEPALLAQAAEDGISLYLTDLSHAGELKDLRPEPRSIIVIGNEARGVQEAIKALPHRNLMIPMPGGAESLNAAVAASLIMYELRGRG